MLTCTFFGHRDTPQNIELILRSTLVDLIENKDVLKFYVGNQGGFDYMVKRCLAELKERYPIDYAVVLAYFPGKKQDAGRKVLPIPSCRKASKLFRRNLQLTIAIDG